MTGLIWKDFMVSKRTVKAYLGIMIFYAALTVMGMFSVTFVTAFVSVMLIMLPISAFAYDEQAKWDRYAMSLPIGRSRVVGARYLFTLLIVLVSLAFALLAGATVAVTGKGDLMEVLVSALTTLAAGLLIADVLLPLCYKVGPERARPYLYALVFIPALGLFLVYRMGIHIDTSWLDRLARSSPAAVLGLFSLPLLAALALTFVSYLISCRVAAGKEY
ncbi:MAG: ABC-2 transporter permease [Lawsonibacter sp.]|nr:ABC-2 transporter permease [Lawsonibacter sp.]